MRTSRREFLQKSTLTTAGLLLTPGLLRGGVQPSPTKTGLFFDPEDLTRIRETVQLPRFKSFWAGVVDADAGADRKFLSEELKLNNHAYHLLRARQILERTAFAYAVTGTPAFFDLARLALERILEYKKWDYFLEGGERTIGLQRAPETTIAVACAREWLDDRLTAATRSEMERQIAEKGAPACYLTLYGLKYPERVRGWSFDSESDYKFRFDLSRWPLILNSTNLKVIPIAGLAIAGSLLYGKHPQAESWVNMALQSARAFSSMFGSDGSYDEGVGYWGYTALHLTMTVEVLRRRLGVDEHKIINYPGTIRYGVSMAMPTIGRPADCVNFGDAWQLSDVSTAGWVARHYRDGLAQHMATQIGTVNSLYAAIWFDPTVEAVPPPESLKDVRFVNDIVVSRTGWDAGASVVAMRSGGPANHEHADRNSVIFSAYGERLLHDPFKAAYSHTEPHWMLRLTEAHTALLIDGKGHQYHDGHEGTNASWAEARVEQFTTAGGAMVVSSDATQAYRLVFSDAGLVRRTLIFLKPDVLIFLDQVRFTEGPRTVQLRFQVDGDDGNGSATAGAFLFRILRPNASLQGQVTGTGQCAAATGMLPLPKEHGIHPYVEVTSASAKTHTLLTVCTASGLNGSHGALVVAKGETEWKVSGTHNGRAIKVAITVTDEPPKVTL